VKGAGDEDRPWREDDPRFTHRPGKTHQQVREGSPSGSGSDRFGKAEGSRDGGGAARERGRRGLLYRGPAWHSGDVTQIDPAVDALVSEWLPVPEAAARLGIPVGRIRQLLRDRKLLAVTRPDGTLAVPASFIDGGQVVKGLQGTLTLLFDCGFDEAEALRWLFTADESLPGTPIEAIARHRSTEVNRRAQALAM